MNVKEAPKHVGRMVAIGIASIILVLTLLVGAYAVTLHEASVQDHQRAVATAKRNAQLKEIQEKQSIQGAIPLCEGLVAMDAASHPPVTNASNNPLSYGHKLARAIHQFSVASKCPILLNDVAHHAPVDKILRDLGEK